MDGGKKKEKTKKNRLYEEEQKEEKIKEMSKMRRRGWWRREEEEEEEDKDKEEEEEDEEEDERKRKSVTRKHAVKPTFASEGLLCSSLAPPLPSALPHSVYLCEVPSWRCEAWLCVQHLCFAGVFASVCFWSPTVSLLCQLCVCFWFAFFFFFFFAFLCVFSCFFPACFLFCVLCVCSLFARLSPVFAWSSPSVCLLFPVRLLCVCLVVVSLCFLVRCFFNLFIVTQWP